MASKYYKGYKFIKGGKSRPGIIGVKPKSGGVVDEFKSKKLKELGKTQKKLKSQDKAIGTEMSKARDRGATRKQLVKGRKFQRDIRRATREGDKLRKDVLRVGKKDGGRMKQKREKNPKHEQAERKRKIKKEYRDMGFGKMIDEGDFDFDRASKMKKGGKVLKAVDKKKNPGLAKLPTHVRNKMGYMKKGGRVRKFGGGKK